jgi:hypothetical protein
MQGDNWSSGISIEGLPPDPQRSNSSSWNRIGSTYFETTGTRVIRGRAIDERDTAGAEKVAVVNQDIRPAILSRQRSLGRRLGIGGPNRANDYQIVGVTEDVKYTGAAAPTRPMIFLPTMQIVDLGRVPTRARSRARCWRARSRCTSLRAHQRSSP